MMVLFQALFGLSVLESLAFIVALGSPRRHEDRGVFWFFWATAWAAIAVDGVLFVALLGQAVSPWTLAGAVMVQDVVFGWRLWLAVGARRAGSRQPSG